MTDTLVSETSSLIREGRLDGVEFRGHLEDGHLRTEGLLSDQDAIDDGHARSLRRRRAFQVAVGGSPEQARSHLHGPRWTLRWKSPCTLPGGS